MRGRNFFSQPNRLALLVAVTVVTQPVSLFAASVEELVKTCSACHGEKGIPQEKITPVIWGQNEGYMYLQLRDFKKGTRKSDAMSLIVKDLERDDMRALAAYFAKRDWPKHDHPPAPADVEKKALTASLAMSCTVCHQGEYEGDGTTGRIAGQSEAYLNKTAKDFRDGTRANNPGMASVYRSMEEDDIAALNQYLAGLRLQSSAGRR